MDVRKTECEDWLWIRLTQDRVQWWALLLVVLNPRVSPLDYQLI